MPTSAGPNSKGENSLVFAFDLADTKNSYIGEPATNLQANGSAVGHNSGGYGNVVTVVNAPEKGSGWKKVTINNRGSNFRIIQWTYTSMVADTMYCHSTVFDWGNMRGKGYFLYLDGNGTGTRAYYRPGDYVNQGSGTINSSMPDGKFAATITHTASHTHAFFIGNNTTGVSGLNDYFYYKEYQVEVNSHPTPYTLNTRSATEGLLDLIGNNPINISTVSFDSNAEMLFDGTNDQFAISDPGVGTSFSIEIVIKVNDYSNGPIFVSPSSVGIDHFFRINNTGTISARFVEIADSATDNYISSTVLNTEDYYHVVISKSPSNGTIYVNGVAEDSHTPTLPAAAWSGAWRIGARWNSTYWFNGELPVIKVYNHALSAEEVLANFQVTRKRFNI